MPADLTAILLPIPPKGPGPDDILRLVVENAPPTIWVRLLQLRDTEIVQLEVLDGATGLPCVSPSMVDALSKPDRKAMFVHVNHQAKQMLLHAYENGKELAALNGEPNDGFVEELQRLSGYNTDELVAADDGTRLGFGQAASRTYAIVRGRPFAVPPGTPTSLGTFAFHDRGYDLKATEAPAGAAEDEDEDEDDEEEDTTRVAFFAFDYELVTRAWKELPGPELARVVASAPEEILGPLFPLREEARRALAQLEGPPGGVKHPSVELLRAFEILALSHAPVFATGDRAGYLDERVLPLLAAADATPVIDDDEEAKELEDMPSILQAMVEVLPVPKPPGGYGPILESLGNSEVNALAPWAKAGEEYAGTVFRVQSERLLKLAQALDGNKLGERLDQFCRALYEARHGQPQKPELYLGWRGALEQRSGPDIERFLTDWAELRIVMEMAALNKLAVGLLVYDGP